MVFDHPMDIKVFDSNQSIAAYQLAGFFVQEVFSLVAYSCVQPGNF